MITWEPWSAPAGEKHNAEQPDISLARIAAGDHDDYIRSFARQVAAYRGPVLIRLMHEMNGHWFSWGVGVNGNTAADFVAAWRHVHRVFAQEGAGNVSWVWSINNLESADAEAEVAPLYPGDRYVDWVATSGFNWGDAYDWSSWRDADAIFGSAYRVALGLRQADHDLGDRDHRHRRRPERVDHRRPWPACARPTPWSARCSGTTTSTEPASTSASRDRPRARWRPLPPIGEGWLQEPDLRYIAP